MHLLSPISTLLLLGFSSALGMNPDEYAPEGDRTGSSLRRRLGSGMTVRDYGSISGTSMGTKAGNTTVDATGTSEESLFVKIDEGDTSEEEGSDANTKKKKPGEPDIDIVIDSDGS